MDQDLDLWMEDHISGNYGSVLDALNAEDAYADEYPDLDEPWDEALAQQELEDFEQADEYYGYFGGDGEW